MRAWVRTSSADTGSSQTTKAGFTASARAITMRWRCPPENSWGCRRTTAGSMPTRVISSATRSGTARACTVWCTRNGSARICATVMRGFRLEYGFCSTNCMCRRIERSSAGRMPISSRPIRRTEPASAACNCRTARPVVVLPEPDSPTRPSVSPRPISKLTPSTARTGGPVRRAGKVTVRLRTCTRGAAASAGRCPGAASPEERGTFIRRSPQE